MTPDYFDAEHTGGDRKSIEIEVKINADHVMDFAHEIRDAAIESVLKTIDDVAKDIEMWDSDVGVLKKRIRELRKTDSEKRFNARLDAWIDAVDELKGGG